jgi:hypothetical protein
MDSLSRFAPWLVFVVGVAVIWIPPWPPMADLPQHAGQAGLLKDLILGHSPWANEVRINLFTPYLIGYALATPLAMVMPMAAALKTVLTVAYAAFGLIGIAIADELGASRRLDSFHFVSFFGFAYSWGLYTFLVAAPVGLAFIWLAILYARQGGARLGLALTSLGLALLFSHGLVFLLSLPIGAAIVLVRNPQFRQAASRSWPFVPPLVMAALIFFVMGRTEPNVSGALGARVDMGPAVLRLLRFVCGAFGYPGQLPIVCFILMMAAPFLGGLKMDMRRRESLVIAVGTIGAAALAPDWLWGVLFVQPRLTLFLPSAWAWLFSESQTPAPLTGRRLDVVAAATGLLALGPHLVQAVRFAAETRDFTAVLERAQPGRRAIGLVLDMHTATGVDPAVYEYFPSWYQADRHGFVDHSLAAFHTEVVRFRTVPPVYASGILPFAASHFDWRRDDGGRYDYFFVRSAGSVPARLFAGAPCSPKLVAEHGEWRLFERSDCATAAPSP